MPSPKVLLVDGYNAIHRIPEVQASLKGGLEYARNRLALHVVTWNRTHPAFECVIVFDGDPRFSDGQIEFLSGIRCVFSEARHGGDAEIIRFVRDFKGRTSDITVVSDDNSVANNCRAQGANVEAVSYIMTRPARKTGRGRPAAAAGRGMDRKQIAAINEELKAKFKLK